LLLSIARNPKMRGALRCTIKTRSTGATSSRPRRRPRARQVALGAATLTPATAQSLLAPPPGFDTQPPLIENWNRQLGDLVDVSFNIGRDAPELSHPAVRERHKIYCYLLMKLVVRFWNGNKRGPLGTYPLRQGQIDRPQLPEKPQRYRGEMIANPGGLRVNWDRYLGFIEPCQPSKVARPALGSRDQAHWLSVDGAPRWRAGPVLHAQRL
jgi:hypothetical protein